MKRQYRPTIWKKITAVLLVFAFLITSITFPVQSSAQIVSSLPKPGLMVNLSLAFNPPILKGIKVYTDNPLKFDFILDKGEEKDEQIKTVSNRLVKYFLASLTVPENELWVNLSPYEKDRIVTETFGQTEMGRDLLAQDYLLKQLTASLIYPENEIGQQFWDKVYREASEKFGSTDIPVDTFNKVWIVPEKAVVFENIKNGTAYIVESKLKVMLESDYMALEKNMKAQQGSVNEKQELAKKILRQVVIPAIEKEINTGKNFILLRQVYNSLILATWYKKKIKESLLSQIYVDKKKVSGVNIDNPKQAEKIWLQYVKSFKKGIFNYIKEEYDSNKQQIISKHYFSGGAKFTDFAMASALQIKDVASNDMAQNLSKNVLLETVSVNMKPKETDFAMKSDPSDRNKKPNNIFSNLNTRPDPRWQNELSEDEIIREAVSVGLSTDLTNLSEYEENLDGLLPYYKQMVIKILLDYPDYNYIVLGRDADLFFDALKTAVIGTDREEKVKLLSVSGPLREKLSGDLPKAQKFLGQFIDFKAALMGTKRYLVIDTGFEGSTIKWVNDIVRSTGDIPLLDSIIGANGRPLDGILMKSQPSFGYPQIKFDVLPAPNSLDQFRMPSIIRATRSNYPRDENWVNYVIASVSQLMPKFTDHLNDLVDENDRLTSVVTGSKIGRDLLPPVNAVQLKVAKGRDRQDWLAPVHPVAAVLLQRRTVDYFNKQRGQIWQIVNEEKEANLVNKEASSGKNAGLLQMWEEGNINDKFSALSAIITFADGGDKQAQYALETIRRLRSHEEMVFDEKDVTSVHKAAIFGSERATRVLVEKIYSSEDWEINGTLLALRNCAVMGNEIAIHGLATALIDSRQKLTLRWKIIKVLMNAAKLNSKINEDFLKIRSDLIKSLLPRLEMSGEIPYDISMKDFVNLLLKHSRLPVQINVREVADINTTRNLIRAMNWTKENVIIVSVGEISYQLVKDSFDGYQVLDRGKNPDTILKIELLDTPAISFSPGYVNPDVRRFKFGGVEVLDEKVNAVADQMNIGERKVIVLGSPHGGEIQDFLKIYHKLYGQLPVSKRPLIVIAPRNPTDVNFLVADENLLKNQSVVVRTQADADNNKPFPSMKNANVLLLNTRGELMTFYRLATVTFVGRGHNIIEPARLGKPVLFEEGDWLSTNADAKDRLKGAGGAVELNEKNFKSLMDDSGNSEDVGRKGLNTAQEMLDETNAKAAEETANEILPFLLMDSSRYGYVTNFSYDMQEALAELAVSYLLNEGKYQKQQVEMAIRNADDFFIKQSNDKDVRKITNVDSGWDNDSKRIYKFLTNLVLREISSEVIITASEWIGFLTILKLTLSKNTKNRLDQYEQLRFQAYLSDVMKTDTLQKLGAKQRLINLYYVLQVAENFRGYAGDLLSDLSVEKERYEDVLAKSGEIDGHFQTLLDSEDDVEVLKLLQKYFKTRPFYRERYNEIIQKRIDVLDQAMANNEQSKNDLGGIDFNTNKMDLQVRNNGEAIKFNIDPAMFEQLKNAPGFEPVIINILPMTNLKAFLGLNDQEEQALSS